MTTLYRIMPGRIGEKTKCLIGGLPSHKCGRHAKWFLFPAGPGTLDTTQFSNLEANVCDDHIIKAMKFGAERRKKEKR